MYALYTCRQCRNKLNALTPPGDQHVTSPGSGYIRAFLQEATGNASVHPRQARSPAQHVGVGRSLMDLVHWSIIIEVHMYSGALEGYTEEDWMMAGS